MSMRQKLVWGIVAFVALVPLVAVGFSAQLAWRDPIYIGSGFAGVAALSLMLIQVLLAGRFKFLGISPSAASRFHLILGQVLVLAVFAHVAGLYLTSPLDVVDVFLLRAPTVYSFWGLLALYALFATFLVAMFRRSVRLRPKTWRKIHGTLAAITAIGTVAHTVLIQGTMEPVSKGILCFAVLAVTAIVVSGLRPPFSFGSKLRNAHK